MRRSRIIYRLRALVVLSLGLGVWTNGEAQRLIWLGTLGGNYSVALDVSADGSVVVGLSRNAAGRERAFRWQNGVMQDLGTLGGSWAIAYGVSADGSVVVGNAAGTDDRGRAFRWTTQTGMQPLTGAGLLSRNLAADVSADGAVVVGAMSEDEGEIYAFRWIEGRGAQDLGTLGGIWTEALGVSADGSVVVGMARDANFDSRAFRWVEGRGMEDLGSLGAGWGEALAVSADGAVVVGWSVGRTNNRTCFCAFRWQDGVMQNLGTLGGMQAYAYSVSRDGSLVVGWSDDARDRMRAFWWTAEQGMRNLNETYASLLTDGSILRQAYAVSPDGRYIVGGGYNATTRRDEAYLLDTGPRCSANGGDTDGNGCVDDADLLAVLFVFGDTGQNLGGADVDCDGAVDDADLLTVLFNFGSGC